MRNPHAKMAVALAAAALALPASAATYMLDFSGSICGVAGNMACGNGSQIGQSYGDAAGLDVSHRSYTTADGVTAEAFLKYWGPDYSNLTGVAWGGFNGAQYSSEITFTATGGGLTLNSFDFGDWFDQSAAGSTVEILDAGTMAVLWNNGGAAFNPTGAAAVSFAPGVSSSTGLILRWHPDAFNVGIDNISITAIPEPGSLALALGALGLIGGGLRRRR